MTKFVKMTDAMLGMSIADILKSLTFTEKYNCVFINKLNEPVTYMETSPGIGRWPLQENLPEWSLFQTPLVSPDPASGVLAICAEVRPGDCPVGASLGIANNCKYPVPAKPIGPIASYINMKTGPKIGVCISEYIIEDAAYAYQNMGPTMVDTSFAIYYFGGMVFKRGATVVWTFYAGHKDSMVTFPDGRVSKVPYFNSQIGEFTF